MAIKSSLVTLLAFVTLLLLTSQVSARPWAVGHSVVLEGRAAFTGQTTFQTTTSTTDSSGAPITETCTITLTPTTVNGQDEVVMVKSCVTTSGGVPSGTSVTPSSTTPAANPGNAPPASSSATAPGDNSGTTTAPAPSSTVTSGGSTGTAAPSDAPFVILGTSSIPTASAHRPTETALVPIGSSSTAVGSSATGSLTPTTASGTIQLASATSLAASTASLAASSQSPAAQFSLPGKNLSVLPIGLGVFAGISVIALIVVGWVTYERTKYRKNFRARKLAEAGGEMGYGGMAARV